MQRKRIPFQGLGAREWLNLALAAIVVYYLAKPAMEVYFGNTYVFLGGDFLSFWSAGWLANQHGFAAAYDPSQLAEIQYSYTPKPANVEQYQFIPVFTFFLPIFLLPFQLLAMIPITPAFILWTVLNLLGSILYLFFFLALCFLSSASSHALTPDPFLAVLSVALLGSDWDYFIDS